LRFDTNETLSMEAMAERFRKILSLLPAQQR
jgi:hypothetical protein